MKIQGITFVLAIGVGIGAYMLAPKEKPAQTGGTKPANTADATTEVAPAKSEVATKTADAAKTASSANPVNTADAAEPVVKEAPVIFPLVDAPPKDYEGPVRGLFLEGKYVPQDFVPTEVVWDKARLNFNIGDNLWPDAGVRLAWLQRDQYLVPFGLNYQVSAENKPRPGDKFEVWLRYRIADTRAQKQKKVEMPYTLDLRLDPDSGEGGMTGYINLESTNPPVTLRGRFEAQMTGERQPPCGWVDLMKGSPATICYVFSNRFREQFPGVKFEVIRTMEMHRQKTVNKLMRLGYVEVELLIEGEKTFRNALMVLSPEGWECAEILEPWQVPEAFPILEPQAPPNGGIRPYLGFITARHIQSSLTEDSMVFGFKNEFLFGGQPTSWCLSTISYRSGIGKGTTVKKQILLRKSEFGWAIEAELLPGETFDQKTGQIQTQ